MKERKVATLEQALRRSPQLKLDDIETMRKWVTTEYPLLTITDMRIVLFLHCSDYDVEVAKGTMTLYYDALFSSPHLYLHRRPAAEDIRSIARAVAIVTLDGRDKDGNVVVVQRLLDPEPSKYDMGASLKYAIMLCEVWQLEHGTAPGIVLVYDQKEFGLGHMARSSLSTVRNMVHFVQDCMPFNVRAIHVVNTNAMFGTILAIFRPFMRSSLISKIHAHREGRMEDLYQHMSQEILPKEYGGNELSLAELNERDYEKVLSYSDYFEEEDQKLFNELERWKSTRPEGFFGRISAWFRQGPE